MDQLMKKWINEYDYHWKDFSKNKKLTAANIDKNAVIENVIETLQKPWESEEKTRDRKLRNNFMNASRTWVVL